MGSLSRRTTGEGQRITIEVREGDHLVALLFLVENEVVKCVFLLGAIGAGKSTALRYLESKGAEALSADEVVHRLYQKDSELIDAIGKMFPGVLDEDLKVNRQALAAQLLLRPGDVLALENLVHPKVRAELVKTLKASIAEIVVYELPIARDTTDFSLADAVIVIDAQDDVRLERLTFRGLSKRQALERMTLHPRPFIPSNTTLYRIQNDGEESQLFTQLDAVWNELVYD